VTTPSGRAMRLTGGAAACPTLCAVTQPAATSRIRSSRPLDLVPTLFPVRRGGGDPCFKVRPDGIWRATRTPRGPATERLVLEPDGTLLVEAWGAGAEWLVERAPALVGELDDDSEFRPAQRLLRELRRRFPGLRIGRSEAVFEAAAGTILEQKVQGAAAWRSWRSLVFALGEAAPGPLPGLFVPPAADRLAAMPYHAFHAYGVERRRADTLRRGLEEAVRMPLDLARARLSALPGMGVWSAAEIALVALGDADAVSVGDYHLPHVVSWALAGEPRGTDERMLELLEPYRGHRARVIRLLLTAGIAPPRRGPHLPMRDLARIE
jgi:3-methyladenine DNA glycosylase/8-oxoguanine DNA glycosylase